ncbi:helix-turn-helix domain-containing protein [Phaeobacter gallaeciensis]|uniref:helix-turn-helix domain-containing protein n=1 Tax=Phaeobacter gallaeciensis TaxID=60890 RepID=UPI003A86FA74
MYDALMVGPIDKNQATGDVGTEMWRKRLRQALDDRGLDYGEVSVAAGNNDEYVSKVLNGRFNPTVARILRICEVAKIDMAYLFSDSPTDGEREVIQKSSSLTENDAELVSRLVASSRAR